jgi:hypothetical protein
VEEVGDDAARAEAAGALAALRAQRAAGGGTPPALASLAPASPPASPLAVAALRVREHWPRGAADEVIPGAPRRRVETEHAEARRWHYDIVRPWLISRGGAPPRGALSDAEVLSWHAHATDAGARRVRLRGGEEEEEGGDGASEGWWRLYAAAAAAALRGRCRVCQRPCEARHPVLRVRMCDGARGGCARRAHPVLPLPEALAALHAAGGTPGGGAERLLLRQLPHGVQLRRTYRRSEPRARLCVLRATLDSLLRVMPPQEEAAAAAAAAARAEQRRRAKKEAAGRAAAAKRAAAAAKRAAAEARRARREKSAHTQQQQKQR